MQWVKISIIIAENYVVNKHNQKDNWNGNHDFPVNLQYVFETLAIIIITWTEHYMANGANDGKVEIVCPWGNLITAMT